LGAIKPKDLITKGQFRMDYKQTLTTLDTKDEDKQNKQKNTTQKTKKMSNMDPPKNKGLQY